MAGLRFLIDQLPPDLGDQFSALQRRAVSPSPQGDLEEAFKASEEAYGLLLGAQPPEHRYHKGWPLHNMAAIRLQTGGAEEARALFLRAFVEDVLSRGEESPRRYDEIDRPAALNLVFVLDVSGRMLVDLAQRLRARQASGRLYQSPEEALDEEPLERALPRPAVSAASRLAAPDPDHDPEWRRVAEFGVPWEDRVFVGGSYVHHRPTLRIIRDEIRRNGFDGVLVAEFKSPGGMSIRNKSLTLLKGCRRAVFELSASGGQLVEFDRVLEYETEAVLVVYRKETEDPVHISSMTASLYPKLPLEQASYADPADLRAIVRRWLRSSNLRRK